MRLEALLAILPCHGMSQFVEYPWFNASECLYQFQDTVMRYWTFTICSARAELFLETRTGTIVPSSAICSFSRLKLLKLPRLWRFRDFGGYVLKSFMNCFRFDILMGRTLSGSQLIQISFEFSSTFHNIYCLTVVSRVFGAWTPTLQANIKVVRSEEYTAD